MEKQKQKISLLFMRNTFLKLFIGFILICEILFDPVLLSASEFKNIDNNLTNCKLITNCTFQNWKINDSEKAFAELIQILENTPRINIIKKEKNYIHAIATSRIMKFIDDIEIRSLDKEKIFQVKSSSRLGFYDLGVNKRRVETLRFRLIDLYG